MLQLRKWVMLFVLWCMVMLINRQQIIVSVLLMMLIVMELMIVCSRLGCCQILWNVVSDSLFYSDMLMFQLDIKVCSVMLSSGMLMVIVSQVIIIVLVIQCYLFSGSVCVWDVLFFMVIKWLVVCISCCWSIISGMVMQISIIVIVVIRWQEGVLSLLVSLQRQVVSIMLFLGLFSISIRLKIFRLRKKSNMQV